METVKSMEAKAREIAVKLLQREADKPTYLTHNSVNTAAEGAAVGVELERLSAALRSGPIAGDIGYAFVRVEKHVV